MHVILGLLVGVVGSLWIGMGGLLLGGLVGVLAAEVLALRKRMTALEKAGATARPEVKMEPEEEVVFAPPPPEPPPVQAVARPERQKVFDGGAEKTTASAAETPTLIDRFFGGLGTGINGLSDKIVGFFTTGNLVLKIGVIIVFFGVAFLLKYAAQRNMIPVEIRLAGVALAGMAMLGVGWRLRFTRLNYGLILQGGGVGILYLVVFAAAKMYDLLPMVLALAVMVGLVALSCLLAVLQDSRALAVFGIVGGFLAPVLMSTGGGSHVLLFSYYALLNAGILGIAWAKSWRELNLVGFFFTFAIGTLWGSSGYRPEHFQTTEPFLILFFVFYVLISILFAHRQPINLRGFVDGPLVFGLPLIVSGLQYFLVRDMQYGMAFSVLGFGMFYLALATLLWRKLEGSMHLLCEAFLALGVVFGSLTIPLALDGHLSASIWALEGAGMVWVGTRQKRVLARHFGILLQLAAAVIFLDSVWYPFDSLPFANRYFFGCCFLAIAALVSSYFLDRHTEQLRSWEKFFALPLLIWGLAWWYIGGLQEVNRHAPRRESVNGFLLYCSVSSMVMGMAVNYLRWKRCALALLLQLPAMILLVPVSFALFSHNFHLFAGWGGAAWILAFIVQYRILLLFAGEWPKSNEVAWHLGTMWLLLFIVSHEAAWAVGRVAGLAKVWSMICWGLVPSAGLLFLVRMAGTSLWPIGKFGSAYLGAGGILPAIALGLYVVSSCSAAGSPAPLPYLPLLNPLEISALLAIGTLFLWILNIRRRRDTLRNLPKSAFLGAVGILLFLLLNSVVARSVHFFAGIPYHPESLYRSVIFQAAIAALWGFGALALTVKATRQGSRLLWSIGAALLGMVVVKLFLVDLSGTGTIARIVSFLVVGVLMLIIGYFSPLPPKKKENSV
jgi:uncharacterized membrane protein